MSTIAEKQHPSHPHQLTLMSVQTPYRCHGCKNEGCEPCYQCWDCGFYLHEQCALGSRTHHPFFKERFLFSDKPSIDPRHVGFCVACGESVQGFRYTADCNNGPAVFLHPCCLKLPLVRTDVDLEGVTVKLSKKISWPSKCLKCQSRKLSPEVRGWAYVSTCGNYHYHVACVKGLILEKWRKDYFDRQSDGGETTSTMSLVVEHGNLTGRKARRLSSQKIQRVLQLVVAAIFGDGISTFIQLIVSGISA
jgi:hypothetical protein